MIGTLEYHLQEIAREEVERLREVRDGSGEKTHLFGDAFYLEEELPKGITIWGSSQDKMLLFRKCLVDELGLADIGMPVYVGYQEFTGEEQGYGISLGKRIEEHFQNLDYSKREVKEAA